MSRVIVQVPTDKKLRDKATKVVQEYGFSSLQEVLRVFMAKLARREISVNLEENVEYLTRQEEAVLEQRYKQFLEEKKKGRTFTAHSVKEMMKQMTS